MAYVIRLIKEWQEHLLGTEGWHYSRSAILMRIYLHAGSVLGWNMTRLQVRCISDLFRQATFVEGGSYVV